MFSILIWFSLSWLQALYAAPPGLQNRILTQQISDLIQKNKERLDDITALLADSSKISTEQSSRKNFLLQETIEHQLRQEFLDRLVFRVVTHYRGQNLRQFFVSQLQDIAHIELNAPQSDARLWRFCTYLAAAIQTSSEPEEKILGLIQAYIQESSLVSPLPPQDFLSRRHYTNGNTSEPADGVKRENLGRAIEVLKPAEQTPL